MHTFLEFDVPIELSLTTKASNEVKLLCKDRNKYRYIPPTAHTTFVHHWLAFLLQPPLVLCHMHTMYNTRTSSFHQMGFLLYTQDWKDPEVGIAWPG